MSAAKFNPAPTIADLPAGHPFRNPKILLGLQIVFPLWQPMTDAEYLAKPHLHPVNASGVFGLKEIFPPYNFTRQEFPGGAADWAHIEWPSHAYSHPDVKCCNYVQSVIQVDGYKLKQNGNCSLHMGECFGCKLERQKLKKSFCCAFEN